MTILVSHQAVPPHFTTKLRSCLHMFNPLGLRKVWKRLCICENEATIDFHQGSAICNK